MAPIKRKGPHNEEQSQKKAHQADHRSPKRLRKSEASSLVKVEKSAASTPGPSKLLALRGEEAAFPRGGASILTPLEHKQIQLDATRDVLFEQNAPRGKISSGPANDDNEDEEMGHASAEEPKKKSKKKSKVKGKNSLVEVEKHENEVRIESLSFKRTVPGTLVLGQVSQVNNHDLALAIPNSLTGYVSLTAVSDQLDSKLEGIMRDDDSKSQESTDDDIDLNFYFSRGQYLRAYVSSTGDDTSASTKGKKRFELSVHPRLVNHGLSKKDIVVNSMVQASVVSVEDHGLVMDLGLDDSEVKGFMSSRELGNDIDHSQIQEGAVFLCLVTGLGSNGNVIKLSADVQKAGNLKKLSYVSEAPTIDAFLPGTAVEVLVDDVHYNGVVGKIMGMLNVTADLMHSGAATSGKDLERSYKIGEKIKARVICTFPNSEPRKIGVSTREHILRLAPLRVHVGKDTREKKEPEELLPISTIVEEAQVVKVVPDVGLIVKVGVKGVFGFTHISRITDGKIESLSESTGRYKVGSIHRARIIGYNAVDGIFMVSMEQKVLDQSYLRIQDIPIGEVLKGKVEKFIINATGVAGVLVNIAEGITGLVPEMHMSDVHLIHPERKFKEGTSVTARVLATDPGKRRLRLTLKKALVNSDATIIKSYEEATAGSQCPGTIIKLLDSGAIVQFYGTVQGFLPKSEMSEAYIENPSEHFRIGQVVNVHVLSVDAANGKMQVSCKDPLAFGLAQQAALKKIKAGQVVHGSVVQKSRDDIVVELEESGLQAILLLAHLSDGSDQKNLSIFNKIRTGQALKDLVVLEKIENKRVVTLSSKPSLVNAAKSGKLLTKFDDVKEGDLVQGFVHNITFNGIFVRFAGGLKGLLLKHCLPDEATRLPDFGMRKYQSISATIKSVDHGQQRFLLTLKEVEKHKDVDAQKKTATNPDKATINAIDEEIRSADEYVPGKLTKAKITSIKATQINVKLADNVQGRIDMTQIFDSWDDIKDKSAPLRSSGFIIGQILPVKVIGIHDARNHKFLPISHRGSKTPVFELSAKTSDLSYQGVDLLTLDRVNRGSSWTVFINNIGPEYLWVSLSPGVRGRIRAFDLSDDISLVKDLEKNFPVGSALKAHVKTVDADNNRLDLAARSSFAQLAVGMVLPGKITKVTERYIMVHLNDTAAGPVNLIDMSDDYSEANPTKYSKQEMIRVCILDIDTPNKRITLSTRPSRVLSSALTVKDPEITDINKVKVNDVVRGFITNVTDGGVFVTLGHRVTAFVKVSDLSDSYIKDWKSAFQVDQLVKGKVTAVDPALNHIQLNLKRSVIEQDYVPPITFSDLKVGQVITGKIRKVEDFGVFIVVDNSANVSGLCHNSQMAEKRVHNVKKLYDEGDAVKAKILKLEPEKRRISFGLKASYFEDANNEDEQSDSDASMNDAEDGEANSEDEQASSEDGGVDLDKIQDFDSDEEKASRVVRNNGPDHEMEDASHGLADLGLSAGGFDWTANIFDLDDECQKSGGDDNVGVYKSKKKRRKAEIKVDRTGELDANGPQSVSDFERLLLSQPDSSYLWLSYMAFQLQLSEIAKAREIAERAIRTINIREESEKMNVWVALLNLENTYGTDDTLEEVFKRACQYNDAQEIHERLTSIYIQSGKNEKANSLFAITLKKFSQSPKLYLNYATFLFNTQNNPGVARALLPRATQALPSHVHLDVTSKFAALEFRCRNGDSERGRTLFEGLFSTFPKRLDIWNILLDLEIKKGDREQVRRVFGRVVGLGLRAKKAKFFFKRWLEYEEKEGDRKSVEAVKAKAAEYVKEYATSEKEE